MTARLSSNDIIAIEDFTREDILEILDLTHSIKHSPPEPSLQGKILGSCFFEPSTRTRLSFESAMYRLGGKVVGFSESSNTSTMKGESLADSMRVIEKYVDLIVIRHPLEGAAQLAADVVNIPVINAGDGANQHPTQTFLDLYSIQETQESLDHLSIALVGDLRFGRTVHSLAQALTHFKPRLYLISPQNLEMPKEICEQMRGSGVKFSFHQSIDEVIHKLDILYLTRTQEERFTSEREFKILPENSMLKLDQLSNAKPNLRILHPLPRNNEIHRDIDNTPYAYYFQQAENGLYTRQAILKKVLS